MSSKQLIKTFKIKDRFITEKIEQQLRDYRKTIGEFDDRLNFFTADRLEIISKTKIKKLISSSSEI